MNLDLSKIKNVHFIGIGGIGISAIARMMLHEGKKVTGQDIQKGEILDELEKLGINITLGQTYKNIPENTNLVIYTVAIETYDKLFFDKLRNEKKFKICSYPEILGIISNNKYTVAICGTHGKTTTTGMIAEILEDNKNDPTVIIGSLIKNKDGNKTNFIWGEGKSFIVEACEYRRSFLNINPNILVITNIDADHLDYYKDIEDIKNAFHEFAMKVSADGFILCNPNDKNIEDVIKGVNAKIINWGEYFNDNLKLKIPGLHNRHNAAGGRAAPAATLGISKKIAEKYVSNFSGTWRRFEFRGKLSNGVLVYDDYAHHPVEISSTLEGFRELYSTKDDWKITVIFQPHLFSRTKLLFKDFAKSFSLADKVFLLPIYFAREINDGSISSKMLADEINKNSHNAVSFINFETLEKNLISRLSKMGDKDIIVTMGAGEAFKVADFILKNDN